MDRRSLLFTSLMFLMPLAIADSRAAEPMPLASDAIRAEKARPARVVTPGEKKPAATATPAIRLSHGKGATDGRVHYLVEVTNVAEYPAALFVAAGPGLPPNPCSETRMVSLIMIRQSGETRKIACKALPTRASLQSIEFDLATPLADADSVQFVLQDRQAESHVSSQNYLAGWAGVAAQLAPAGCNSFLGRSGSFLCSDASGFAACESLRKAGKPIACTQAGKK